MNVIAAVDKNWGIGKDGKLLCSIPADMKFFKTKTMYKIVVMGRKTLESLPDKQPLKCRINVVMTKNRDWTCDRCFVVHDTEELLKLVKQWQENDVYVIGGGQIYKELLPYCKAAYITKIGEVYEADAYFPDLDDMPEWELESEGREQCYNGIPYQFCTYKRK